MDEWEKAELKRQEDLAAESEVLMKFLREAKDRYPDAKLTVVVDNDCWHLQSGVGIDLSEDETEDIYMILSDLQREAKLDHGPERLCMLMAVGHGFFASRP